MSLLFVLLMFHPFFLVKIKYKIILWLLRNSRLIYSSRWISRKWFKTHKMIPAGKFMDKRSNLSWVLQLIKGDFICMVLVFELFSHTYPLKSLFSIYFSFHIPYARHYNPRFVYFLPPFWSSFMYCDLWPYVWLVFKSGF